MIKRILVTGGAGFIGSHTVDFLLNQNLEVVVIDNLSTGKLLFLNLFHPNLRFVQADVRDDSILRKELARCDAVLHLAALPSVPLSIKDPIQSLRTNTEGFLHVLEALRYHPSPVHLVYATSAAVYGAEPHPPCSDEAALSSAVLSPYALEKMSNEQYADLYFRLFGIKSLGLRYFNVYGSRQDPESPYSGVISRFMESYQKEETLTVFGKGEQSRDFIHISDVARANALALASDAVGVMNIATGVPETLLKLIQYIEEAGDRPASIHFAPSREGDIHASYATTTRAAHYLNFQSLVSLREGIKGLFSCIKK